MRNDHPSLYLGYMIAAACMIGQGLNFLFRTPAFMPLGTDKWIVGVTFLGFGLLHLALLLFRSDKPEHRPALRMQMTGIVFIILGWAAFLTIDAIRLSQTSFQLPYAYIIIAGFASVFLAMPFTNPAEATIVKTTTEGEE